MRSKRARTKPVLTEMKMASPISLLVTSTWSCNKLGAPRNRLFRPCKIAMMT